MALLSITRKKDKEKRAEKPEALEINPEEILITKAAAQAIQDKATAEGLPAAFMRVGIMGGGCSGLTYTFSLVEADNHNDAVFTAHDASICVDPKSLPHLVGTALDFIEEVGKSTFVMRNPNVKGACSCGQSFAL